MKITKAHILSQVKEAASSTVQKNELVSYDLDDKNTRIYAADLLTKVKESAGPDTKLADLFKWTAEDFCCSLVDLAFPNVAEASAELEGVTDVEGTVSKLSDDATSILELLKSTGDPELLMAKLDMVAEAAPTEEIIEEATTETAAETVVVEESIDTTVSTETIATTDEPAVDATGSIEELEEVKETVVPNPFKIIPASEKVSDADWTSIDTGATKTLLREALESGAEGMEDIIREVYSVVGDYKDPATWKYPHHVVSESGEVLLNPTGLAIASNYVSTRFRGDFGLRQQAAKTLSDHHLQLGVDSAPAHISRVAESSIDLHMISLEIMGADDTIMSLDNTSGEPAVGICVAESVANSLRDTGLIDLKDPTVITIDSNQLEAMAGYLTNFVDTLMGKTVPVQEAAPTVDTSAFETQIAELANELNLYKKKVDTLHSLLEGSPLEGVAESVVGAKQIESVEALKTVAESIGVKRLITTRKQKGGLMDEAQSVTESASGLESLVALSKLVTRTHEAKSNETEEPVIIVSGTDTKRTTRLVNLV